MHESIDILIQLHKGAIIGDLRNGTCKEVNNTLTDETTRNDIITNIIGYIDHVNENKKEEKDNDEKPVAGGGKKRRTRRNNKSKKARKSKRRN